MHQLQQNIYSKKLLTLKFKFKKKNKPLIS
jgi:hypothetical protein